MYVMAPAPTVAAMTTTVSPGPVSIARRLGPGDVADVSRSMARAFFDDPVVGQWCLADESKRMARLERMFSLWLHKLYLPARAWMVSVISLVLTLASLGGQRAKSEPLNGATGSDGAILARCGSE
jgi:hypothetical protein